MLDGNLSAQLGMHAHAVAGPAEPCHQAREEPAFVPPVEIQPQIGVRARLAKECVNARGSAHRTHVKQAGCPLGILILLLLEGHRASIIEVVVTQKGRKAAASCL